MTTWYTSKRFQIIAVAVLAACALGEGLVGICLKDNDFLWHRDLGRAFLQGDDPYAAGGYHYLPARTMINAATAWLPYRSDRLLVFVCALAALAWTLRAWQRLADRAQPLDRASAFAAVVFTLGITGAYLQRDLDDCGLQILLLFFLTAAVTHLAVGQARRCGCWLALAAVYKLTPFLFLPYLCYKRQWRAASWMVLGTAALCLAPACHLGWQNNLKAHEQWWAATRQALSTASPSENGVEPPNHRNQSLTLALARTVETYPPGHPLHMDHPLFVQFGHLEPAVAKRAVQGVLVVFALALAWRFRKRLQIPGAPAELAREWAALTILTALLSPLCWLQHLVLVVPAVFLLVRARLGPVAWSSWQSLAAMVCSPIMIFAGQRDLLGQGLFLLAMSYKVHTWAALSALAMVLMSRQSTRISAMLPLTKQGRSEQRPCFPQSKSA